ncbi:hypothetical protein AB0C04_23355 [Micromonospora sp. NPDC048909]
MSLLQRISTFLRSPKGQQLVARGRQELAKPANQQKLRGLAARLNKRR